MRNFALSWVTGPEEGRDAARAVALLSAACPTDRLACFYRAGLEAEGLGLPANRDAAVSVLEAGCRDGNDVVTGFACAHVAELLEASKPAEAVGFAARGCALGNGNACALQAAMRLRGGDMTAKQDVDTWCARGFREACAARSR